MSKVKNSFDLIVERSLANAIPSAERTVLSRLVATLKNYEIRVLHFQCNSQPSQIESF